MTKSIAAPPVGGLDQLGGLIALVLDAERAKATVEELREATAAYLAAKADHDFAAATAQSAVATAEARVAEAQATEARLALQAQDAERRVQALAESAAKLESGWANLNDRTAELEAARQAFELERTAKLAALDAEQAKTIDALAEAERLRNVLAEKARILTEGL